MKKLTRTYAVSRRINPSIHVIRPTCVVWRFISKKSVPDSRKSPNGQLSPKLKLEKLTRTYAVSGRIFPLFQVIRPT
jgi:hypothetical protein